MMSRLATAYLWVKILRVTLQPGEYEILSSVNLGRKKHELRMLVCSANLGCTHWCEVCTHKQNVDIGKPRVTNVQTILEISLSETLASENREVWIKDLSPQAMLIPDTKAAVDKEWKEVIQRHTKQQQGKPTLLHCWTSINSEVYVQSLAWWNLYINKIFVLKNSRTDEKNLHRETHEPWQKHHFIAKEPMRKINKKGNVSVDSDQQNCKKNSKLSPSTSTIIEYSGLFPDEFWQFVDGELRFNKLRKKEENFDNMYFESSKHSVECHEYGSQDSNNVETKVIPSSTHRETVASTKR